MSLRVSSKRVQRDARKSQRSQKRTYADSYIREAAFFLSNVANSKKPIHHRKNALVGARGSLRRGGWLIEDIGAYFSKMSKKLEFNLNQPSNRRNDRVITQLTSKLIDYLASIEL